MTCSLQASVRHYLLAMSNGTIIMMQRNGWDEAAVAHIRCVLEGIEARNPVRPASARLVS